LKNKEKILSKILVTTTTTFGTIWKALNLCQCNYWYRKYIWRNNRAGAVTQVVEHLPSKCKVLGSSPNTAKKERKKKLLKFCESYKFTGSKTLVNLKCNKCKKTMQWGTDLVLVHSEPSRQKE
jgi:hypothetical protein